VALPEFFQRAADAITPVADISRAELEERLAPLCVELRAPETAAGSAALRSGFLFAANLLARLYPAVHLLGPEPWVSAGRSLTRAINPRISDAVEGKRVLRLSFGAGYAPDDDVAVTADGWNVSVDSVDSGAAGPIAPPAAMAAAALGVGEIFRVAFSDVLGSRGRVGTQPAVFNLLTARSERAELPVPSRLSLDSVCLVGAGAIGQAALATWAECDLEGRLTVIDPERLELSNMQRYVLGRLENVGQRKVDLAARALKPSAVRVKTFEARWGQDDVSSPMRSVVAVALDNSADRIAVAAGLHRVVHNAWTQPLDLGWSRHARFGVEPCLACLYYPTHPRPSEHELIGAALGEHELRVLAYLTSRQPIGAPLPIINVPAGMSAPPEAARWQQASLLADLVESGVVPSESSQRWQSRSVGDLYQEGICGGALLTSAVNNAEVVVPLAHQSALAGVMLATSVLIDASPELASIRGEGGEWRLDVTRGLPQTARRPRQVTKGCLCQDEDYRAAYDSRWN
jgi:hypothetical protein